MQRPLVLALASGLLAVACALVEAPPPAGTVMVQLDVNNQFARPVDVAVTMGGASGRVQAIPGAAQPSTVPPKARGDVRFFVPITGSWTIVVNGQDLILGSDLRGRSGVVNDIGIDIDQQGNTSWWCRNNCP
jgi:hypothetical protein